MAGFAATVSDRLEAARLHARAERDSAEVGAIEAEERLVAARARRARSRLQEAGWRPERVVASTDDEPLP